MIHLGIEVMIEIDRDATVTINPFMFVINFLNTAGLNVLSAFLFSLVFDSSIYNNRSDLHLMLNRVKLF